MDSVISILCIYPFTGTLKLSNKRCKNADACLNYAHEHASIPVPVHNMTLHKSSINRNTKSHLQKEKGQLHGAGEVEFGQMNN